MSLQYAIAFTANTAAAVAGINQLKAAVSSVSSALGKTLPNPFANATAGGNAFGASAKAAVGAAGSASGAMRSLTTVFNELGSAITASLSVTAIAEFAKSAVDTATKANSALISLGATADHLGVGAATAIKAAIDVTKDGALTLAEASDSLKNLLSKGFDTTQSVKMIRMLADSAAFADESTMKLGQRIVTTTAGILADNSAVSNNSLVEKNLSDMYKDTAKSIGVATDALTKQQKVDGLMVQFAQETANATGNLSKRMQGLTGDSSKLNQSWTNTKALFGDALTPAFGLMTKAATLLSDGLAYLVKSFEFLGASIVAQFQKFMIFVDAVKNFDFKGITQKWLDVDVDLANFHDKLVKQQGVAAATEIKDNINPAEQKARAAKLAADNKQIALDASAKTAAKQMENIKAVGAATITQSKADADAQDALLAQQLAKHQITAAAYAKAKGANDVVQAKIAADEAQKYVDSVQKARDAKVAAEPKAADDIAKLDADLAAAKTNAKALQTDVKTTAIKAQTDVYTASLAMSKDALAVFVANAQGAADKRAAIFDSQNAYDTAAWERSLAEQATSYEAYLAGLKALQIKAADEEVDRIKAQQVVAARTTAAAQTAPERAQGQSEEMKLQGQLEAAIQHRSQVEQDADSKAIVAAEDMMKTRASLLANTLELEGRTYAAAMARIAESYREQLNDPKNQDPRIQAQLKNLQHLEESSAGLAQIQKNISESQQSNQTAEDGLQTKLNQGVLTGIQYEVQLRDLRLQSAAALQTQVDAMAKVAAAHPNDTALQTQLADMKQKILDLKAAADSFNTAFNRSIGDSVTSNLEKFTTFAALVKGIFADILTYLKNNFAKQAGDTIFKALQGATKSDSNPDGKDALGSMSSMMTGTLTTFITGWFTNAWSIIKGIASSASSAGSSAYSGVGSLLSDGYSAVSSYFGYKSGGYTGDGAVDAEAGVVHGKEYVFDAKATANWGVGTLEYMRKFGRMPNGFQSGGYNGPGASAALGKVMGASRDAVKSSFSQTNHFYYSREEALASALKTKSGKNAVIELVTENAKRIGIA